MEHDRHSIRLRGYDYRQPGYYFVTILTQQRYELFGSDVGADLCVRPQANEIKEMVDRWIIEIPKKFDGVKLDEYIIMPNHFHGILFFNSGPEKLSPTLGTIVRWFKTMTTNEYLRGVKEKHWPILDKRLWQRNYYERIIRDEQELFAVRKYIQDNPKNWDGDINYV